MLQRKILSDIDNTDIEKIFTTYRDEFRSLNFEFIEKLEPIDRNLTQNFKNRAEKFDDTFDQMQAKFINSMMKQNESVTNKLNNIRNNLFPGDKLQERTINILYFLNKYNLDTIDFIFEKLNLFDFNHQLIDLSLKTVDSR